MGSCSLVTYITINIWTTLQLLPLLYLSSSDDIAPLFVNTSAFHAQVSAISILVICIDAVGLVITGVCSGPALIRSNVYQVFGVG